MSAAACRLRPETAADLSVLAVIDSAYDDFGRPPQSEPHDPDPQAHPGGLAVVDPLTDEVFGNVSWIWRHWGPTPESRCLMLGISLRANARGRGIGTAAQRQLVDHLFTATTTHRIEAHTDVTNVAEQRALTKAGFTAEGIVRGAHWRGGVHHDGWLYSILRPDWEASRSGSA